MLSAITDELVDTPSELHHAQAVSTREVREVRMLVEELRTIFDSWKAQNLSEHSIELKESYNPRSDPNDDYQVIYEAIFQPATLDRARIEFWVTDSGHVAVGIETYERIVERLGLRAIRHGFAAGHEPRDVTRDGLRRVFDTVTQGKMFIVVKSALSLATSAKIYMSTADCDAIERSGYRCSDWISAMPTHDAASLFSSLENVLDYQPW